MRRRLKLTRGLKMDCDSLQHWGRHAAGFAVINFLAARVVHHLRQCLRREANRDSLRLWGYAGWMCVEPQTLSMAVSSVEGVFREARNKVREHRQAVRECYSAEGH